MKSRVVEYRALGGMAEVVVADPGPGAPAVIVLHEVWGMTSFIESVCEDLAELGFAAYAPLLFWRHRELFTRKNIERAMSTVWNLRLAERYDTSRLNSAMEEAGASNEVRRLLRTLYYRRYRQAISADVSRLAGTAGRARPALGVLGYSMGGGFALSLAAVRPTLGACATVSAEPPSRSQLKRICSPILSIYGSEDKFMTGGLPDFVEGCVDLRKDLTLRVLGGAGHEFFDPGRTGYEAVVAADAWRLLTRFLAERLGAPTGI
jgi:carboxymethylenebutenolidase